MIWLDDINQKKRSVRPSEFVQSQTFIWVILAKRCLSVHHFSGIVLFTLSLACVFEEPFILRWCLSLRDKNSCVCSTFVGTYQIQSLATSEVYSCFHDVSEQQRIFKSIFIIIQTKWLILNNSCSHLKLKSRTVYEASLFLRLHASYASIAHIFKLRHPFLAVHRGVHSSHSLELQLPSRTDHKKGSFT